MGLSGPAHRPRPLGACRHPAAAHGRPPYWTGLAGLLLGLVTVLLLSGCALPAAERGAPAGWQAIAKGLAYREQPPGVHALRMDLQEPSLRLRLSPAADQGRPIDARPDARAALAALNASFFDRQFRPRGLTVSEGLAWPDVLAAENSPLLACDAAQRCRLQLQPPYATPADAWTVVAGTPWLLRDGQARTDADDAACPALCARTHPRTALGLSADGHWLLLVLIEGRRGERPGASLAATAQHLREAGAWTGFNLDGGGSTALLVNGASRVRRPANESAHRPLANVLLVEAR